MCKIIDSLETRITNLKGYITIQSKENEKLLYKISDLKLQLEDKKDKIICLLESNKELSQANEYLTNKINLLEKLVKQHEENECRINTKYVKSKNKLDKVNRYLDDMLKLDKEDRCLINREQCAGYKDGNCISIENCVFKNKGGM